ncbi:MAG TPA: sigma factor-like helix-turn-helix DNA-binding protein, partial [Steroidobacteraceae bacterium]|nr:sigma factor-like helix-turn-helix DNA-binding protein [Steroidobacteraceae bacterium]
QVENSDWDSDSRAQLATGLTALDERSRSIIQRRWLTDPKATLHELAAEYGVSAERIRQIEVAAFTRLRGLLPAPAV